MLKRKKEEKKRSFMDEKQKQQLATLIYRTIRQRDVEKLLSLKHLGGMGTARHAKAKMRREEYEALLHEIFGERKKLESSGLVIPQQQLWERLKKNRDLLADSLLAACDQPKSVVSIGKYTTPTGKEIPLTDQGLSQYLWQDIVLKNDAEKKQALELMDKYVTNPDVLREGPFFSDFCQTWPLYQQLRVSSKK